MKTGWKTIWTSKLVEVDMAELEIDREDIHDRNGDKMLWRGSPTLLENGL